MKLGSGGPRAAEMNRGAVEERLDALQSCKTSALLADDILQELWIHLVDRGPTAVQVCAFRHLLEPGPVYLKGQ